MSPIFICLVLCAALATAFNIAELRDLFCPKFCLDDSISGLVKEARECLGYLKVMQRHYPLPTDREARYVQTGNELFNLLERIPDYRYAHDLGRTLERFFLPRWNALVYRTVLADELAWKPMCVISDDDVTELRRRLGNILPLSGFTIVDQKPAPSSLANVTDASTALTPLLWTATPYDNWYSRIRLEALSSPGIKAVIRYYHADGHVEPYLQLTQGDDVVTYYG